MAAENKKVLLAEDNIVNQKLAALLLTQLGLPFDVVSNGSQAVQAVQNGAYAIILMDCQMPEMDGFQATKAIRKLEALNNSYTPIIAVTALAMVGDRERCIAAGMDDYISKPIDRQVLKIKLNHWLQREFVLRNQELARKYDQAMTTPISESEPISLSELREFYGSDLDDVLRTFIAATESHLAEIKKAISERNAEQLAHLAHELKGSSASIGAKQMAKLALFLERAAGLRDWPEANDTFDALGGSFQSVRHFLQDVEDASPAQATILPRRE